MKTKIRIGLLFAIVLCLVAVQADAQYYAYIPNRWGDTVSVIDTSTHTVIATVVVEGMAHGVAVAPDGKRVYVPNSGSRTVSVIDTLTNTVIATIADPRGPSIAVNPVQDRAYVPDYHRCTLSIIDTSTNTVVAVIPTQSVGPTGVAVTPDGSKVFIAFRWARVFAVFDTFSNSFVAEIELPYIARGVAVSPDGTKVYFAEGGDPNGILGRYVHVVDASSYQVLESIQVGVWPYGVAVSPDGAWVYTANHASDDVSVIDTSTNTVVATIPVGEEPSGVGVTPDGKEVYVANQISDSVSVIDTSTNSVVATIAVGDGPEPFGLFITPPPVLSCAGFEPPMASGPVTARGNRALPLKAQLFDVGGFEITDLDLSTPPVLQVTYRASESAEPMDVTGVALPAGFGTDGNEFEYNLADQVWQYNLKTKNYSAGGTYTITIVSGDDAEYAIDPTCTAVFLRSD